MKNNYSLSIMNKPLIGCIIVTFNRLDKLKHALECYVRQTQKPAYILVVNNSSTDGTKEFLDNWILEDKGIKKYVIHSEKNLGGSGGFYLAEEKAIMLDAPWIMISDDDAYPAIDYLEGMQKYINTHRDEDVSIVCGKVLEHGGYDNFHRGYLNSKWARKIYYNIPIEDFENEYFYPDFTSYVGIVVNRDKMKIVGLVNKEYFIWQDDVEHSYRLSKVGKIVGISQYEMEHDTLMNYEELSWKTYYGWRNFIDFRKRHYKLHYPFAVIVSIIKTLLCPMKGKNIQEVIMRLRAIRDGVMGNMGMNEIYRPGWKP